VGEVLILDAALKWRKAQRAMGHTVVLTNGHFDLLHVGHVRYLQAARALGDALIIGLNSDASTAARKPGRPIVPQEERAELLAALGCVDAVVIFDAPTAEALVEALRPDIYAKGGDWNRPGGPTPPEAAVVERHGGRIAFLPYLPDRSTTLIIQRIQRLRMTDF
jgi:rfaE bifunctional protein nucleotidyltransferase chain/domain